ncbi:hypothetical protein ABMY26_33505 [Azospirillum sp. HJ39]|uniref:hypothetical protein n=1 Tax=Azospirillum sp. HJ39 TaxID=3159496 RepID=UPI003556233C
MLTKTVDGLDRVHGGCFLRGIKVPEEWLQHPSCLLPALLAADAGGLPEGFIEDDGALLGWRGGDTSERCQISFDGDLDRAIRGLHAALVQAGKSTYALDELELRLVASLHRPQYVWDKETWDGGFTDWERTGSVWSR